MFGRKLHRKFFAVALLLAAGLSARAQQPAAAPPAMAPQPQPNSTTVVQPSPQVAPQVVTVVHRLSGIKVLSALRRKGTPVATVDDAQLLIRQDVLTSITAGIVLDDGHTIIARLPQAEAEISGRTAMTPAPAAALGMAWPRAAQPSTPAPAAEDAPLMIVRGDGQRFAATYVGLDGGTGLSLIRIDGLTLTPSRDADQQTLSAGQRVHLFAPVRATNASAASGTIYLRVGEVEGAIKEIVRAASNVVVRLSVLAPKNLSPEFIGGVVLNDAGETVGIVESSSNNEARIIPAQIVRRAAARVQARRGTVPQPWLGVGGEPLMAATFEQLKANGWPQSEAFTLMRQRMGILLTKIVPGTPAARADLRPGDVILRVNDFDVQTAEDFTFMLNEAGVGADVNFTILRGPLAPPATPVLMTPPQTPMAALPALQPGQVEWPKNFKPFVLTVKLSESLNLERSTRDSESAPLSLEATLSASGLETVSLSSKAAARLGARGGLLVVSVDPESAASRAGVRAFDIIEAVNERTVSINNPNAPSRFTNTTRLTLNLVRAKRKLVINVQTK